MHCGLRLGAGAAVLAVAVAAQPAPRDASGLGCDDLRAEQLAEQARSPALAATAAANLLRQAWRACPQRGGLLLQGARMLLAGGEHQLAGEAALEYLDLHPDSVPALEVQATSDLMAQRFERALATSAEILRHAPRNPTAMKVRGNALYLLGQPSRAQAAFLRLLDLNPSDSDGAYMLGRIYYEDQRFDLAAAQFQKVIRLDPRSYKAYDNLGLCFEALGDAERAIRHYLAAIQIVEQDRPEYDWPYANLANLLIEENDPQRGFDAASTAARLNPESARNFFLGGKALTRLGRHREAVRWLERSAALDRDYPQPLYLLGQTYQRLGNQELAERSFKAFESAKSRETDEIR